MKMTTAILCFLFVSGCATISETGHLVLNHEGYTVERKSTAYRNPGAVSPSMATQLVEECYADETISRDGAVGPKRCDKVTAYSSATTGYLPSLISGAAIAGSGYLVGQGLKKSGAGTTTIENTSGAGAVSVQQQGQSGVINP